MAETIRKQYVHNPAHKFSAKFSAKKRKASGAGKSRHRSRSNPTGEIVAYVLNPGGRKSAHKGGSMATTKKKQKKYGASHHHHKKAASKGNPARRHHQHFKVNRRRRYGRNPGNVGGIFHTAVFAAVGAIGSKLATQAVLGANNTGIIGYGANAIATLLLGLGVGAVPKIGGKGAAQAVYVGGALQILLRAVTDYTPWGQVASLTGVGDYQVQHFLTPQRLIDGLRTAEVQNPGGPWAPTTVIASAAPPAGHGVGYWSGGGLYDGGGLYN
jgi:hypothetical protein